MKNLKQPIRKIVSFLNNPDEDGGFWVPNIQRPFVWSEDQICRLFDSIMREYPLSTLLVWKTTSGIRRRKFIDNWKPSIKLSDFYVPEDERKKCLVLDGQQRLQSLFIGLCGSYEGRELYFDILSGELSAPDDVKFRFAFKGKNKAQFPWVSFKELVFTTKKIWEMRHNIEENAGCPITPAELHRLEANLNQVDRTFKMDETIAYQELDSIDNPSLYDEDDVVEIFIRANSGGTKLGKSDLLFSLLSSKWDVADEEIEGLLDKLNQHGFAFDRDFVLKSCLVLTRQGARYEVKKFRNESVRKTVEASWNSLSQAMVDVLDFVRGKTYIQCDKALSSYLALIPLMYLRYNYPMEWNTAKELDSYLLRSLLVKAFGGRPDSLLDALTQQIDKARAFAAADAFDAIRSQGRTLEITEQQLCNMGYGSDTIHLLFNIWYKDFNHTPAYEKNFPQIDHIFPRSVLRQVKVNNPETGRMLTRYNDAKINQLANCMLLTREENGAGGKGAILPEIWFGDKDEAYLNKHLIPKDRSLLALDRFDDFIEARMLLIKERFNSLIAASYTSTVDL